MWNKIILNNEFLGWGQQVGEDFVFFGNSSASKEKILSRFPNLQLFTCQQVHSTNLVEASFPHSITPEADAVWTSVSEVAVAVVTADCLPVLISHPNFVCAIHAGWRGVVAGIIPSTLKTLLHSFSGVDKIQVYVGPHILVENFEVKTDVLNLFKTQLCDIFSLTTHTAQHPEPDKHYIDLNKVAASQMSQLNIANSQVHFLNLNTYTDKTLASFRRTGSRAERNISFVTRLQSNCRLI